MTSDVLKCINLNVGKQTNKEFFNFLEVAVVGLLKHFAD